LLPGRPCAGRRPALWWLSQDYVSPDESRTRDRARLLRAEPYESGVVLPHERTTRGHEGGSPAAASRAPGARRPIFLLYDGALDAPGGEPRIEVELDGVRNRLWRHEGEVPAALADASLLIADGHHRYETTLAFHAEDGTPESAWLLVVIVPTEQEGLTIFPTHRVVDRLGEVGGTPAASVAEALASLPAHRSGAVLYRGGHAFVLEGEPGEPDTALVARLGGEGTTYTADLDEAVSAWTAVAEPVPRPPAIDLIRAC
jgi:hypothetical protein